MIERGPCDEFLLDNSTAFRSVTVEQFAERWGISLRFRAAYAPSGNGIVERNHRTIKRIAARGEISPEEATYWYNVTPRKETEPGSVPSSILCNYRWRVPFDVNLRKVDDCRDYSFTVGEEVWVKPAVPSCTKPWAAGRVTKVVSKHTVCVDGMPRHVRDVRKRRYGPDRTVRFEAEHSDGSLDDYDGDDRPAVQDDHAAERDSDADLPVVARLPSTASEEEVDGVPAGHEPAVGRRSTRERQRPVWMADYVSQ